MRKTLPDPRPTPLVLDGAMYFKLERTQLTGSAKYRLVHAKITAALASGKIDVHTVLTEVTSGSTGVALAYAAAFLGLRATLHVYQDSCLRKQTRIRGYGAEVIAHSRNTPLPTLLAHLAIQSETGPYWHLNQYDRQSSLHAYQALGREIVQQIQAFGISPPQILACPVGTGGLIQGVGTYLRTVWPIKIIAVEPEPHVSISGMRNTQLLYMGNDDSYDRHFPDARLTVHKPDRLAHIGGYTVGLTTTAVYEAIRRQAWQNVLIIAPD